MDYTAKLDNAEPKRHRFKFTLYKLLIAMTLAGCGLGLSVKVRMRVEQGRRQQVAVKAIQTLGGCVSYDYEHDQRGGSIPDAREPGPDCLHSLLGDDYFRNVYDVTFAFAQRPSGITNTDVELIGDLVGLKKLNLDVTQVGDAGLEHLAKLTQLELLSLDGTRVTDAGIEQLKALTHLRYLYLAKTSVTDAGVEQLMGVAQLQWLDLRDTKVTDVGVGKIRRALPDCQIIR